MADHDGMKKAMVHRSLHKSRAGFWLTWRAPYLDVSVNPHSPQPQNNFQRRRESFVDTLNRGSHPLWNRCAVVRLLSVLSNMTMLWKKLELIQASLLPEESILMIANDTVKWTWFSGLVYTDFKHLRHSVFSENREILLILAVCTFDSRKYSCTCACQ